MNVMKQHTRGKMLTSNKDSKSSKESSLNVGILERFLNYMLEPTDPSNLAVVRILFGLLMAIDIPLERGLSNIHFNWEPDMCYFPLFNVLYPLSIEWMHVVYVVMFFGAVGILLGFMYRFSCIIFMVPYWYVFWLDKGVWNNHSYLYGLISIMLLLTDCNRYWSLDGLLNPRIRNAQIPRWNYFIFRFQISVIAVSCVSCDTVYIYCNLHSDRELIYTDTLICQGTGIPTQYKIFLVYFYAGIKKLDQDWMTGYSMSGLGEKWVFDPFRYFLSDELIDLILVHICGLCFDLFVGFFLLFDKSRPFAMFIALMFHGMNSQLFSIGMFAYTMIATLPLFCATDWPKRVLAWIPSWLRFAVPLLEDAQPSSHCVYSEEANGNKNEKEKTEKSARKNHQPTSQHKLTIAVFMCYVAVQLFLPYSHFITKGYNGWTQGLYGYSWDMMIHSWSTQHIRIRVVDRASGNEIFIKPGSFIGGGSRRKSRWSSHPDMMKQYIACLAEKLKAREDLNVTEPAIYLDVWRSMNSRFQQRFVNPNIDMVTAPWFPFTQTPWVQPLLIDLSPWRKTFEEIERKQRQTFTGNFTDIVFVADFPGLMLENFVSPELNTSLTVLEGRVHVMFGDKNHTLDKDEEVTVPSNETHVVYTVSETPACWMYVYLNTTSMNNETIRHWILHPETRPVSKKKAEWQNKTLPQKFKEFVFAKHMLFSLSFWNTYYSLGHLAFGVEYPWEVDDQSELHSITPGDTEAASTTKPSANEGSSDGSFPQSETESDGAAHENGDKQWMSKHEGQQNSDKAKTEL